MNTDTPDFREAAERLATVLATADHDPDSIPEQFRESVVAACGTARWAVIRGDYNEFKFAVAVITASPLGGDGRRKWATNDVIGDILWRVNRDVIKQDIAAEVDGFLEDLLGG